jgi:SOS-response transcriptional repressor LexA
MSDSPQIQLHPTTARVYRFIIRYKQANGGASPSIQEICQGVGIASKSTVKYHLDRLAASGRIKTADDGRARHITIPGEVWYLPEAAAVV